MTYCILVSKQRTLVSWFPWILIISRTAHAAIYTTSSLLAFTLIVTQCGIVKTLRPISLSIAQAVSIYLDFSNCIVMLWRIQHHIECQGTKTRVITLANNKGLTNNPMNQSVWIQTWSTRKLYMKTAKKERKSMQISHNWFNRILLIGWQSDKSLSKLMRLRFDCPYQGDQKW